MNQNKLNQKNQTNNKSSNKQDFQSFDAISEPNQSVIFCHRKNTGKSGSEPKRTKKYHALDKYIIFCFMVIIIYTIVHTIIFYKLGIEATVLDALFYGVFGGEVLLCALLKRLKLKQEHELVKKQLDNTNIEEVGYEE